MCPDEDQILLFLERGASDEARSGIEVHLDGCAECRHLVALVALDGETRAIGDPAAAEPALLQSGATLTRYVILGLVGFGGMGVVYSAYDPELDRKVAIKVLSHGGPDAGPEREQRVLREAQSMARLTHPNIVVVHDVGMMEEQVFIVMEFVRGTTLRGWLAAEAHPWREVLDVFRGAGRGLSAAHAAGLVHRDFKPENVLVDPAGRVLVTDFGLARSASPDPTPGGDASSARSDGRITRTGMVGGTPAYMAPEQLDGGAVDPRSDVFSFCVALYEALYRERPFGGDTVEELREAIRRDRPRDAPPDTRVPAWVRQIVLRGLHAEPERRPPSMDVLTSALDRDPGQARRRAVGAALLALVLAAVALAVVLPLREQRLACKGAEGKLAGVWDAARREVVTRALGTGTKPGWETTARIVERTLDGYARAWVAMRTEACEATHVRHEQSDALLDLRMRCLDERLAEVRGLTELLSKPDDTLVDSAAKAAYALSPLPACADTEALQAQVPLPRDAGARAKVEGLRLELAQVKALNDLGRYRDGEKLAADLTARARPLGYAPLDAEALEAWGSLLDRLADYPRAADTLREALWAAERGRDRKGAARTLVDLVGTVGHQQGQPGRGHEYAQHAEAILRGLGGDAELDARLAGAEAILLRDERRFPEGEKRAREALDLYRVAFGSNHPQYAVALSIVAVSLSRQERHADALAFDEQALAVYEQVLGKHHPLYGQMLFNVAAELDRLDRLDEARARAEEALALVEESLGSEHTAVASAENVIGLTANNQHDYRGAEPHLRRALALTEKLRGPTHPYVANYAFALAESLTGQGKDEEAIALYRRTLAIYTSDDGKNELDGARVQSEMGAALVRQKAPAEGLALIETALRWQEKNEKDPEELAGTRFALAKALWATGGDHDRARGLVAQAVEGFSAAGSIAKRSLGEARAWLEANKARSSP